MIGVNLTGMGRKVVRMSLMNALEEEDSRGMISTGDVGCYVEINKIRANKRGIYFLDRDIVRVVHLPNGGVVEPSENIISDPNYPNDPNDLLDLIDTPTPQPNDEFFDDFFDPIPEIASDGDTPTNDDYMDNPVDYANLHTEGKDETPIS